jgi:DNA polymerase-1
MNFVSDLENHCYYMGEIEPKAGFATDMLVKQKHNLIAVDVETISLKDTTAIGVGIAIDPNNAFYFVLFPTESLVTPWHLLKDKSVTKIYHNGIFDMMSMLEYDIDNENIMDTNIMSRLLCYKFNSLTDLEFVHNSEIHSMSEYIPTRGTTLDVPEEVVAKKCMQDCIATYRLYEKFITKVDRDYLDIELQVVPICIEMSTKGLLIDQEMRASVEIDLQEKVDFYKKLCDEEGFNPGSSQQVAYTLAKRGAYNVFRRLPYTNREKTNLSSASEVLEKMEDPLASIVLSYRGYSKLLSTYIKPWANEYRATTRFHLDAVTGRPSSTKRNMQNIPGKKLQVERGYPNCRSILVPDTGTFTDVDWSQLELRILAYLSQDREMMYIYESGGDIHQRTADFLSIPRSTAKNVNFALVYGATDQTLMETAHIKSIERAKQLREDIFKLFSGVGDWISSINQGVPKTAQTLFGRNIRLPDIEEEGIDGIYRKNINYRIQGTAAEILKRGLIACKKLPMVLQIHDEIICDGYVPDYEFNVLKHIAPFETPIDVEYLTRWE